MRGLDQESRGLIGVQHKSARGWETQPQWLVGLLRIAEIVADASVNGRRRAVIITPHSSQVVSLLVSHLVLCRFQSRVVPQQWWNHGSLPIAAVRHLTYDSELLLLRELVRSADGGVALRFEAPNSTVMLVPSESAGQIVPIPDQELPDGAIAARLNIETRRFASIIDFLGRDAGVRYALGNDATVAVVGRKDETRAQLEGNTVRTAEGRSATLADIARMKEFAHSTSFRSRWISVDHATSGRVEPGTVLILNGGPNVSAAVHEIDVHPWIAVLDRSSASLAGAVADLEQYYYSVETRRLAIPDEIVLASGHEVLIFEEDA